jgi:hypothetical protein
LKKIDGKEVITIPELSKELKKTKTELLEFLNTKDKHVSLSYLKKGKSKILGIQKIYLDPSDNPANKDSFIIKHKKLLEKTLKLKEMNNYRSISSYFIQIDEDPFRSLYDQTQEKSLIWLNALI